MNSIQEQVVEWHKSTFPRATDNAIFDKLNEEVLELSHAINVADWDGITDLSDVFIEIADVIIVACALLDRRGLTIDQLVLSKLDINRNRTWGADNQPNGDRPRQK